MQTKIIKNYAKWFALNGLFGVCVWLGFYEDLQGAKNVALFMAWASIVMSVILSRKEAIEKMVADRSVRDVSVYLESTFDIVVTLALVWAGAIFTGIFYFIHWILIMYVRSETEKGAKDATNS